LDDAADALAAGLATGIGRLGVRLGSFSSRCCGCAADFFVEEPSVEDLTAAQLVRIVLV
jgi:F0F1-type ATP synthase membrane subunit c/vacuolar-type H+-ATPase subunit K